MNDPGKVVFLSFASQDAEAAHLGDKKRAFAALKKGRALRDPDLCWVCDNLISLHTDPRWLEFLRTLGLADEQLK